MTAQKERTIFVRRPIASGFSAGGDAAIFIFGDGAGARAGQPHWKVLAEFAKDDSSQVMPGTSLR